MDPSRADGRGRGSPGNTLTGTFLLSCGDQVDPGDQVIKLIGWPRAQSLVAQEAGENTCGAGRLQVPIHSGHY